MRPISTLHVDSELQWGGGQRQVASLCTYLRQQGHGVVIAPRAGSKLEAWAREQGFETAPAAMTSSWSLGSMLSLCRTIHRLRPDVVHLHSSRAHQHGAMAARLVGARLVVATRRMALPISMSWPKSRVYGSWTNTIIAISGAVREALLASGVSPDKVRIIPSGVDGRKFEGAAPDASLRASLGVADGVPIVATAAVLSKIKGVEYLLEAATILRDSGRGVHVVIAGDGDARQELEETAARSRVPASFVGFREDLPALLASVDLYVAPSLSEGLGTAAIEATFAGKAVVASAVGGLKECVTDGETGELVPPGDARALSEAIARLLADRDALQKLGAAGQARAREKYSLENMTRCNEELYFELLGG